MGCRVHEEIGRFAKVIESALLELERCCLLSRKVTAALQMQVAALTGRQGIRRPSREGWRLAIKQETGERETLVPFVSLTPRRLCLLNFPPWAPCIVDLASTLLERARRQTSVWPGSGVPRRRPARTRKTLSPRMLVFFVSRSLGISPSFVMQPLSTLTSTNPSLTHRPTFNRQPWTPTTQEKSQGYGR